MEQSDRSGDEAGGKEAQRNRTQASANPLPPERLRPRSERRRWLLWAWLLPCLPLLVLFVSNQQIQRRLSLQLRPDQPVTSDAFRLEADARGAPELRLQVQLPPNSTASYAIDLLDDANAPVMQLDKDAWRQLSAWAEEGEQGVDDEADSDLALTLRPPRNGYYRLRVELQELLDAAGRPLQQALPAELTVRNHSVDAPLLWFTTGIATALVAVTLRAYDNHGRRSSRCRREERRLDVRQVIGGTGLVQVTVKARYGPSLHPPGPQADAELELLVCDDHGRRCLRRRLSLTTTFHRRDSKSWWIATRRLHLRCPEPASRRLRVTLPHQLPGCSAQFEWGELIVLDGARVLWDTSVIAVPQTLPPTG